MKRLPRAVVALGVVSLLTDASSEMIIPLLPAFLVSLGASGEFVGAVDGAVTALLPERYNPATYLPFHVPGLGLVPGRVVRFRGDLQVPHVGWAEVSLTTAGRAHSLLGPLFDGSPRFYYHVHSYHPADTGEAVSLATGDYGGPFTTIVGRDHLLGVQFHPEKSQREGIRLLSAFAEWTP